MDNARTTLHKARGVAPVVRPAVAERRRARLAREFTVP
jgi:hypothetical protein